MVVLEQILWWALQLFFYAMLGRLVVDMVLSINPNFRPRGLVLVIFEIVLTLTDPVIKLVRRVIKPVRFGTIQLDFGWTVVVFGIFFLQGLVSNIA
ncbi:MAG: YggT family protein [Rhodoluna sp.]